MTTLQPNPSLDAIAAEKLPHEAEHLESLLRMQSMAPYYAWVASLFEPWLGRRILDAGCGVGNFIAQVERHADMVTGIDLSPANIQVAKQRFKQCQDVDIRQLDLDVATPELIERDYDTAVCLDVLEHIEEDTMLMQRLAAVIRPGGHVLIKVPACPWLYGSIDVASDHYRRYTRSRLRALAEENGLTVCRLGYMNLAGVVPYFLKSRVFKKDANFSRTFSPKQLTRIARIMPWLRRLDRLVGPPVGQSLVMVARKPLCGQHTAQQKQN